MDDAVEDLRRQIARVRAKRDATPQDEVQHQAEQSMAGSGPG